MQAIEPKGINGKRKDFYMVQIKTRDEIHLTKRTTKKERKADFKLQKKLNPKGNEKYSRENQIWFDSISSFSKASRATKKVNKIEKSVPFYRFDENGRKIGLVFDE